MKYSNLRRILFMRFFVDTANVEDIRKANDMGIICGVTTNPSLIAKEGRDFKEVISEITSIVDGPISGEVKATTTDAEGMIAEGREIAAIHPNMVVKIPMTVEGLKGPNGELSPIQKAFIEEAAVQCGFCTPGLIMSAVEIVGTGKKYNREELKKLISGHLCRCTGYENILNAMERIVEEVYQTTHKEA